MKKLIILLIVISPVFGFTQDFGCFDVSSIDKSTLNGGLIRNNSSESWLNKVDWHEFALKTDISDGYYKQYYFNESLCLQEIKMEGEVKNGLQEGAWSLYSINGILYTGNFINGKKEGLWRAISINEKGDSVVYSEVEFKNDLLNGQLKYYSSNDEIYKTFDYENGVINGCEIEYFRRDTNGLNIRELYEYSNGKRNGKYVAYGYNTPFDTTSCGEYLDGKKNGRFIYNNHDKSKTIVDYVNNKAEGKFIKYYSNGVLECEFDFKNNLPYNLIQMQDTSGKIIEQNSLIKGNGKINFYHKNGTLASSFEYNNQLIAGQCSRYFDSGILKENGLIYTNNEKTFSPIIAIKQFDDVNLFSARQLNFISGTNYTIYNEDGSIQSNLSSIFNDSLGDDIIMHEVYEENKLLRKEFHWRRLKLGPYSQLYDNGKLKIKGNYVIIEKDSNMISVKNGTFKYYYSNGILQAEVNYLEDEEIGTSYFYDNAGVLKRTKVIETNGGIYNIFEKDTVNKIDELGRKQGKWIRLPHSYAENNCYYAPKQIEYYLNGKPTGTWEYFFSDERKLSERIVWQDSIHSYYQTWNYYQKLIEEGEKVNDVKEGEWKEYDFRKGYLKWKGVYNCGKKEGIWKEFSKNGNVIQEVEYLRGMLKNTQ